MDIQDVDRREVLRYLGYRGQEADGAVAAMVEQSMAELWEAATPRHLYREYPLSLGRITELTEAVLRPGAGTCGGI